MIVRDLFKDLTVRYVEFKKNHKNQYAKTVAMMQSYAIIATQTKLTVFNSLGESL